MIALLKDLQQEVRELKQEVRELKDKTGNSSGSTELIIENPFEELKSFGFKAKSLEEVSNEYGMNKYRSNSK